jgi:hypothetical protein
VVWKIVSAEVNPHLTSEAKGAIVEAVKRTVVVNAQWIIFYALKEAEGKLTTIRGQDMVDTFTRYLDDWAERIPVRLTPTVQGLRASLQRAMHWDHNHTEGDPEVRNAEFVRILVLLLKSFILR